MDIDQRLYRLPGIGRQIQRLYSYFKEHIFFTDMVHIAIGLGFGLMFAEGRLFYWGIAAVSIGLAGHIVAFLFGKKS